MTPKRLRIGTRGSTLARAQTAIVVDLISGCFPDLVIDVIPIRTLGDRLPPHKRSSVDGKTAFTGDIESLLLKGEIDAAVHSMKDLPSQLDGGLRIGATPPRGDPRDALISSGGARLDELPRRATVGTSSLRRRAQLLKMRSDLCVVDLHGNVGSRIRQVDELGLDAIVLTAAGLERLGESGRVAQFFTIEEMVPAAGQATLAVEVRKGDSLINGVLSRIDDRKARIESGCERAFVHRIGGDCYVPVGACARLSGESVTVAGMIGAPDGSEVIKKTLRSAANEADSLGRTLAEQLLELGGDKILRSVAP